MVPDAVHEAVRDPVWPGSHSRRCASFCANERIYPSGGHLERLRTGAGLPARASNIPRSSDCSRKKSAAMEDATQRIRRLDEQLKAVVATWPI